MVTAAMVAMFYLGTASGVMGAVMIGASRSRATALRSLEDVVPASGELPRAA